MSNNADKNDAVFYLAENVVRTNYDDLSRQDVEIAKMGILDTLGALAGGSSEPPSEQLVSLLKEEGGKEESTIMVYSIKVPARAAVLANSSMARALDLEEVHEEAGLHSCVSLVPAAFAVAERQGVVGGKDLITAVVLGWDLMARLSIACKTFPTHRGRIATYIFATFGTSAVAAKLLGFDVDDTVSALGNAYSRATGELQSFYDGALSQRINQGLSASAGVYAAILAQNGINGSTNVLEGPAGYYFAYENGEYLRDTLLDKLGKKFWGTSTSFKPYPNCKGIHLPMEAALQIVIEHDIKPEEVDEIVVHYLPEEGDSAVRFGFFKPERVDPKSPVDLKFSVPWAVGTIVVKRKAWIDDFTVEGMRKIREAVVPIAEKVKHAIDPNLEGIPGKRIGPVIVEIKTRAGKIHAKRLDYCKGSPQNPFTWDEMAERFKDCCSRAARCIPDENIDRVIELVENLDRDDDVTRIARLLG